MYARKPDWLCFLGAGVGVLAGTLMIAGAGEGAGARGKAVTSQAGAAEGGPQIRGAEGAGEEAAAASRAEAAATGEAGAHSGVAAGILAGEAVGGDSRRRSSGGKMHGVGRAQQLQEQREQLPGWQGRV